MQTRRAHARRERRVFGIIGNEARPDILVFGQSHVSAPQRLAADGLHQTVLGQHLQKTAQHGCTAGGNPAGLNQPLGIDGLITGEFTQCARGKRAAQRVEQRLNFL